MKRPTDHERLLADALADDAPADFREALLGETLRHARRRRRWRQSRRGLGALAVLAGLGLAVRLLVPATSPVRSSVAGGCEIIRTQPLPASALVATQPFSPDRLVASTPSAQVIRTAPAAGEYREISDEELLALVAPRPVLLVGCGPQCKQLIFLNPEDEKGFPVN
jgi:hypothetical protein